MKKITLFIIQTKKGLNKKYNEKIEIFNKNIKNLISLIKFDEIF